MLPILKTQLQYVLRYNLSLNDVFDIRISQSLFVVFSQSHWNGNTTMHGFPILLDIFMIKGNKVLQNIVHEVNTLPVA